MTAQHPHTTPDGKVWTIRPNAVLKRWVATCGELEASVPYTEGRMGLIIKLNAEYSAAHS